MTLASWWNDLTTNASAAYSRFSNRKFKEAVMAMCARMAAANGTIDPKEEEAVATLIGGLDELKAYDPEALFALFKTYAGKLNGNAFIGKVACDKVIAGIKGDAAGCAAAVQVCLMIANADGTFEPKEVEVLVELCGVLGIDSAPYVPRK